MKFDRIFIRLFWNVVLYVYLCKYVIHLIKSSLYYKYINMVCKINFIIIEYCTHIQYEYIHTIYYWLYGIIINTYNNIVLSLNSILFKIRRVVVKLYSIYNILRIYNHIFVIQIYARHMPCPDLIRV